MKNVLLIVSFLLMHFTIFCQNDHDMDDMSMHGKYAKGTYSVSGGLLGALNFNDLRVTGDNPLNIGYRTQTGWSAGIWLCLPLGQKFALEPQVMYSFYKYRSVNGSILLPYGGISYISIPLLLKWIPQRDIAFTFGPQLDLLNKLTDTPPAIVKDNFTNAILSLSAGLEILPRGPVTIFGRYIHGINDLDKTNSQGNLELFNSNIQAGIKIKLFGKFTPADTDADGIPDYKDNCPTVAGLAAFMGCPDTDGDGITDADDLCPNVAGTTKYNGCPIPDTDNDGINDEVDKCPKEAGTAKYNGCPVPDTDHDGINDEMDKCPTVAGTAKYDGCPIPDTDGDGINDENDKCPTVAGLAAYDGCPNPDKDNDGVPDVDDWCPSIKGPVDNHGCPRVENAVFNAKMIQFVTGSANLTAQAKKDLREGAKLLNSGDFKDLRVEVQGNTDSDGSVEYNHKLSHRRAEAVKAELIKDGVRGDRLTTIGFGEDNPIADNKTAAGKALNRRVELIARQ